MWFITQSTILRLLLTFEGAFRKIFRTRAILNDTLENYRSL